MRFLGRGEVGHVAQRGERHTARAGDDREFDAAVAREAPSSVARMRTRSLRGSPPWAQARSVVSSSGRSATSTVSVSPRPVSASAGRPRIRSELPLTRMTAPDWSAAMIVSAMTASISPARMRSAEARRSWLAWLIMSPRTSMPALIVSMARTVATAAGIACNRCCGGRRSGRHQATNVQPQSQRTVRGGPRQPGLEGLDGDEGKSQRHRQTDERGAGQNGRRKRQEPCPRHARARPDRGNRVRLPPAAGR